MIRAGDRVAAVLKQDERLLEVFVAASPVFERLRSPGMRRTMARLVTVEQAARLAGVDPAELVARLNGEAAGTGAAPGNEPVHERAMTPVDTELPAALRGLPPELLVELDVRDDLRRGEEPFSKIMAARQALPSGGVLRLRATFEPVPLYHVMGRQGLEHWTEQLADDDWRVWFYPAGNREEGTGNRATDDRQPAADDGGAEGGEDVIVLDVRGLEPPEPMVRTLAALETLPPGRTLLQINVRVPQFLLPRLEEMGFTHEVREQKDGPVRVFIRRRDG